MAPQKRAALEIRAAVDTAISNPSQPNTERALEVARSHGEEIASRHVQHNLGKARLDWLNAHDVGAGTAIRGDVDPGEIKHG